MATWEPTFRSTQRASGQTELFNGLNSRRMFNKDGSIKYLDERQFPMLAMFMQMLGGSESSLMTPTGGFMSLTDPDFKWDEQRPYYTDKYKFYSNASGAPACSASAEGTAFANWTIQATADGGDAVSFVREKDIIQVIDTTDTTKTALFRVTNVDSTTQVDVTLLTNTPGFDVADNDEIVVVGDAHAEGGDKTTPISDKTDPRWGSVQIFKRLVKVSKTVYNMKLQGNKSEYDRIAGEELKAMYSLMERAILFGNRLGSTAGNPFSTPDYTVLGSNDAPVRTMLGLESAYNYANTNGYLSGYSRFDVTKSTYTYADFIDDAEKIFYLTQKEELDLICGRPVISFFNKLANTTGDLQIYNGENEFGIKVNKLVTRHGTLNMKAHPLMIDNHSKNMAFVNDMDCLKPMIFRGLELEENVEDNGSDRKEDQWLIDFGMKIMTPEVGSVMYFS